MVAADHPIATTMPPPPSHAPLLSKLKDWGYCDNPDAPCSLASVLDSLDATTISLLESLVDDLVDMSEHSDNLESKVASLSKELLQERQKIGQLKAENLKLSSENSVLHDQIEQTQKERIDAKEAPESTDGHSSTEDEERLQQWRAQSRHQLQELEQMNQALRAMLNRHSCCAITESNSAAEQHHGGHIILSDVLAPSESDCTASLEPNTDSENQKILDLYRIAEKRCKSMEEELKSLKESQTYLQKVLSMTKEELLAKNKEIGRLSSLLNSPLQTIKGDDDKKTEHSASEPENSTSNSEILPSQMDQHNSALDLKKPNTDLMLSQVDVLQQKVERLQARLQDQDSTIVSLRSELAQKIEQLAFITDEKVVGEEALDASQLECGQLASLIKELDERMTQITTALTTRTRERDYALSAEKREMEARQLAEGSLRGKCNDLLVELQALQDQHARLQLELVECQGVCEESRMKHADALSDLQECQKRLETADKDIEQLRNLITQLDMTREELVGKLKSTMTEKQLADSHLASLDMELRSFVKDAEIRNTEVTQLHTLLEALGKERDHLTSEMKYQAERLEQLHEENNAVMAEARNLKRNLQCTEQKLQTDNTSLQKAESEVLLLKKRLCAEEESRKAAEERCAAKTGELQTAAEDLATLTCDLRFTKNELVEVVSERENLMDELKNLTSRLGYFEQLIFVKDKEKEDLSSLYEQLCEEHQQLKLAAIELDAQVQQHRYQLQNMEGLLQRTQEQVTSLDEECRKYKYEMRGLERQVDITSRSLSQQTTLLDDLHKEKAALLVQSSAFKEAILEKEQKQANLMRQMTATESKNQLLTGVIQEKLQDVEALTTRYRLEHERVRELEQLFACVRAQEHQLQLEHKDSGTKMSMMQERLLSLEDQLRSLQNTNDAQKDKLLRLEALLKEKNEEERRRAHALSSHAKENLLHQNIVDSTGSKTKMHELEMRTISLAADLSKTAALYKDCFTRLQRSEAECAEQRNEYEHVLSILSKVDDDRIQLQHKCRELVATAEKPDRVRVVVGQTKLDSIPEQPESEFSQSGSDGSKQN